MFINIPNNGSSRSTEISFTVHIEYARPRSESSSFCTCTPSAAHVRLLSSAVPNLYWPCALHVEKGNCPTAVVQSG